MRNYGTIGSNGGGGGGNSTVGGVTASIIYEFTRPSNTTPYGADDSVNSNTVGDQVFPFAGATQGAGKTGYLTKAILVADDGSCNIPMRLHLWKEEPTAIDDGEPFLLNYGEMQNYLGFVDFDALEEESTSGAAKSVNADIRLAIESVSDGTIYGQLQTKDAYTPESAGQFTFILSFEQNF